MASATIHTVPDAGGWVNTREGSPRRLGAVHRTQAEAIEAGRKAARAERAEHVIHGRNGQIRKRSSYGHDPHPPKG